MITFTVHATLVHPEHRERAVAVDLIVDTGARYVLPPPDIVDRLGLGDVRLRLDGEEHTTTFVAGPPGCRALFGAFGLELFGLAVDSVHQRLFPAPALL